MASLERSDVERALTRKGFSETKKRRHRFYALWVDGKKTGITTLVSRGSGYKTLGNDLVKKMAAQVALSIPEFEQLVSCELARSDYIALLRQRGRV